MSDATLALAELVEKLAAVGTVRVGRAALETTTADLSGGQRIVSVWSTEDRPAADQVYGTPAYTRSVTVEVKVAAGNAYGDTLDTVLSAVRHALKPGIEYLPLQVALDLRERGAQFFAPAGHGEAAVVTLQYEIDYLERF